MCLYTIFVPYISENQPLVSGNYICTIFGFFINLGDKKIEM